MEKYAIRLRRQMKEARDEGAKNVPLKKYGFVRAPQEDFTDDGSRFTCYYYDPDFEGDTRFRLSKSIYKGDYYISVAYEDKERGTYKSFDRLNGVSIDTAIRELPELVKELDAFKDKLAKDTRKTLDPSDEELDEIADKAFEVVDKSRKYLPTLEIARAFSQVTGNDYELLSRTAKMALSKKLDAKLRDENAKVISKDVVKKIAASRLKRVMYHYAKEGGTIDSAIEWVGTDGDAKDASGNYVFFSNLSNAQQEKINNWIRKKLSGDDFEESLKARKAARGAKQLKLGERRCAESKDKECCNYDDCFGNEEKLPDIEERYSFEGLDDEIEGETFHESMRPKQHKARVIRG